MIATAPELAVPTAVELSSVTAGYRGKPVIYDVSLAIPQGSSTAIIGPSGSGKTTMIRVMLGLLKPIEGHMERPILDGLDCDIRQAIGYIPQNLGLVRNRTVLENVLLGALCRLCGWRTILGRFPASEFRKAREALVWVGLDGYGNRRIETLSGGERRRVAIARALLQRPRLLLADEFLAEVDRVTADEIICLLQTLRRSTGMTLVFVDHDLASACKIAENIVVLTGGRKVAELEPAEATQECITDLFRPVRV